MNRNRLYWRLCVAAVILLSALAFTPLVIPPGKYQPFFLGMPYTLWTGILITVAIVAITYVATRVHPGNQAEEK